MDTLSNIQCPVPDSEKLWIVCIFLIFIFTILYDYDNTEREYDELVELEPTPDDQTDIKSDTQEDDDTETDVMFKADNIKTQQPRLRRVPYKHDDDWHYTDTHPKQYVDLQ